MQYSLLILYYTFRNIISTTLELEIVAVNIIAKDTIESHINLIEIGH